MMKRLFLMLAKACMALLYAFMKLQTTKDKLILVSRQSNTASLDLFLLGEEVKRISPNTQVVYLCKTLEGGFFRKVGFAFFTVKTMYHMAGAKACVLDSYNIPASVLRHKKNLFVVQIWHALGAVKRFGYETVGKLSGSSEMLADMLCMHRQYDMAIAPSAATAAHFAKGFGMETGRIALLGLPRMDYIVKEKPEVKEALLAKHPQLKGKPVVLYAPTFRRGKALPLGDLLGSFDFSAYHLAVKLHPLDPTNKADFGDKVTFLEERVQDLYEIAHVVVTDYSSIAMEVGLLQKPLYFYLYDREAYAQDPGFFIDLQREMPQCTSGDFAQIARWMKVGNYDFDALAGFAKKYVEVAAGDCTNALAQRILKGKEG